MHFVYTENTRTFHDGSKSYTVPTEDIERLLMRPGTRVLRFTTDEGIESIPLKTAVGEIEGFKTLQEKFSTER